MTIEWFYQCDSRLFIQKLWWRKCRLDNILWRILKDLQWILHNILQKYCAYLCNKIIHLDSFACGNFDTYFDIIYFERKFVITEKFTDIRNRESRKRFIIRAKWFLRLEWIFQMIHFQLIDDKKHNTSPELFRLLYLNYILRSAGTVSKCSLKA